MKSIFYLIITTVIILPFILAYVYPRQYSIEYKNSIVIDKTNDIFLDNIMTLKTNSDNIILFRCYDILFDKYNVGDTIK